MKWKPINTLGAEDFVVLAQIVDGRIERLTQLYKDAPPWGRVDGWTHWCEQPEYRDGLSQCAKGATK